MTRICATFLLWKHFLKNLPLDRRFIHSHEIVLCVSELLLENTSEMKAVKSHREERIRGQEKKEAGVKDRC